MNSTGIKMGRRAAITNLIGWSAWGLKWLLQPGRKAFAMGNMGYPQGIQEM